MKALCIFYFIIALINLTSADLLGQNRLGNNRLAHLYGRGRKINSSSRYEEQLMRKIRRFLN